MKRQPLLLHRVRCALVAARRHQAADLALVDAIIYTVDTQPPTAERWRSRAIARLRLAPREVQEVQEVREFDGFGVPGSTGSGSGA
jgi:hypothetical protein